MSKKNVHIVSYSFTGIVILSLMIMADVRSGVRTIEEIKVDIQDQEGILFTDQFEVIDLMTEKSGDYVIGVPLNELNHKILERRVEANPFVKDAQIYADLSGQLRVKVEQSKPLARIINDQASNYIDMDGNILPVHAKHTARVVLIEFDFELPWESNFNETKYGIQLLELLRYIEKDDFWRAQIAHLVIRSNGEIDMWPQVTKQKIEFGRPENVEAKFSKLLTFYKSILPQKGWNTYERVNLKFENQIICE
jgi:cell division protein FtsQ